MFITTLVCSVADVVINYKNNYDSLSLDVRRIEPNNDDNMLEWQAYALDSAYERSDFMPILQTFYKVNITRFVLGLVAWASVCVVHYFEGVGADSSDVLSELDNQLFAEQEKSRRLSGDERAVSKLGPDELAALFAEQSRAANMTKHLLESQHHRQAAQASEMKQMQQQAAASAMANSPWAGAVAGNGAGIGAPLSSSSANLGYNGRDDGAFYDSASTQGFASTAQGPALV